MASNESNDSKSGSNSRQALEKTFNGNMQTWNGTDGTKCYNGESLKDWKSALQKAVRRGEKAIAVAAVRNWFLPCAANIQMTEKHGGSAHLTSLLGRLCIIAVEDVKDVRAPLLAYLVETEVRKICDGAKNESRQTLTMEEASICTQYMCALVSIMCDMPKLRLYSFIKSVCDMPPLNIKKLANSTEDNRRKYQRFQDQLRGHFNLKAREYRNIQSFESALESLQSMKRDFETQTNELIAVFDIIGFHIINEGKPYNNGFGLQPLRANQRKKRTNPRSKFFDAVKRKTPKGLIPVWKALAFFGDERTHKERPLYLYEAILNLMDGTPVPAEGECKILLEKEMKNFGADKLQSFLNDGPEKSPKVPNWAHDVHTQKGRSDGLGAADFAFDTSRVKNELPCHESLYKMYCATKIIIDDKKDKQNISKVYTEDAISKERVNEIMEEVNRRAAEANSSDDDEEEGGGSLLKSKSPKVAFMTPQKIQHTRGITALGQRRFPINEDYPRAWSVTQDVKKEGHKHVAVATNGGDVVGFCSVSEETNGSYVLHNLMVDTPKTGVGTTIVQTIVNELGSRGTIIAHAVDADAKRFWKSMRDFEEVTDGDTTYFKRAPSGGETKDSSSVIKELTTLELEPFDFDETPMDLKTFRELEDVSEYEGEVGAIVEAFHEHVNSRSHKKKYVFAQIATGKHKTNTLLTPRWAVKGPMALGAMENLEKNQKFLTGPTWHPETTLYWRTFEFKFGTGDSAKFLYSPNMDPVGAMPTHVQFKIVHPKSKEASGGLSRAAFYNGKNISGWLNVVPVNNTGRTRTSSLSLNSRAANARIVLKALSQNVQNVKPIDKWLDIGTHFCYRYVLGIGDTGMQNMTRSGIGYDCEDIRGKFDGTSLVDCLVPGSSEAEKKIIEAEFLKCKTDLSNRVHEMDLTGLDETEKKRYNKLKILLAGETKAPEKEVKAGTILQIASETVSNTKCYEFYDAVVTKKYPKDNEIDVIYICDGSLEERFKLDPKKQRHKFDQLDGNSANDGLWGLSGREIKVGNKLWHDFVAAQVEQNKLYDVTYDNIEYCIKKSSIPGAGLGLFTKAAVTQGTVLHNYNEMGKVVAMIETTETDNVHDAAVETKRKELSDQDYLLETTRTSKNGKTTSSLIQPINYPFGFTNGCKPGTNQCANMAVLWNAESEDGEFICVKNIPADAELIWDYGAEYWQEFGDGLPSSPQNVSNNETIQVNPAAWSPSQEKWSGQTEPLMNGNTIVDDAFIIRGFLSPGEAQKIWDDIVSLPLVEMGDVLDNNWNVPFIEYKPYIARILLGTHHVLNGRTAQGLKRNKVFFQTDIEKGQRHYNYTAEQDMLAHAYCDVTAMPQSTQKLMKMVNDKMPQDIKMNHGIATVYIDGDDNIDDHSDNTQSFADDSWFLVVKFGASRRFEFKEKDSNGKAGKCFFNELLPAGTAIWVKGSTANVQTTHGVPFVNKNNPLPDGSTTVGTSGSVVFRCIKELRTWDKVEKKAQAAQRGKRETREKKGRSDWTAFPGRKKLVEHHERLLQWCAKRKQSTPPPAKNKNPAKKKNQGETKEEGLKEAWKKMHQTAHQGETKAGENKDVIDKLTWSAVNSTGQEVEIDTLTKKNILGGMWGLLQDNAEVLGYLEGELVFENQFGEWFIDVEDPPKPVNKPSVADKDTYTQQEMTANCKSFAKQFNEQHPQKIFHHVTITKNQIKHLQQEIIAAANITAMCLVENDQLYNVIVPEDYRKQGRAAMLLMQMIDDRTLLRYQVTNPNNEAHQFYEKMTKKYGLPLYWMPQNQDTSKILPQCRVIVTHGKHIGKKVVVEKLSPAKNPTGVMLRFEEKAVKVKFEHISLDTSPKNVSNESKHVSMPSSPSMSPSVGVTPHQSADEKSSSEEDSSSEDELAKRMNGLSIGEKVYSGDQIYPNSPDTKLTDEGTVCSITTNAVCVEFVHKVGNQTHKKIVKYTPDDKPQEIADYDIECFDVLQSSQTTLIVKNDTIFPDSPNSIKIERTGDIVHEEDDAICIQYISRENGRLKKEIIEYTSSGKSRVIATIDKDNEALLAFKTPTKKKSTKSSSKSTKSSSKSTKSSTKKNEPLTSQQQRVFDDWFHTYCKIKVQNNNPIKVIQIQLRKKAPNSYNKYCAAKGYHYVGLNQFNEALKSKMGTDFDDNSTCKGSKRCYKHIDFNCCSEQDNCDKTNILCTRNYNK
jgi:hypothetical protein